MPAVHGDVAEALGDLGARAVPQGDGVTSVVDGFVTRRDLVADERAQTGKESSDRGIVGLEEFVQSLLRTLPPSPTYPTYSTYPTYLLPTFSYHFRFAVAVPMQTTSTRLSALRSAAAQPAAAIDPSSSSARFVQLAPSAEAV